MAVTKYPFSSVFKHPSLENIYGFLGENKNGATIIACSIAVFKGIFRPMFTMMDKKSDPETKKYAAIREGLTEVAALPLYAVTPWIAGKLVNKFSKETDELAKSRATGNAKFFGICLATLIIPAVCNAVQPPIMAAYKKRQDAKKANLNNAPQAPAVIEKPVAQLNSMPAKSAYSANSGMKVGG